jgi:hypothetical protein
MGKAAQDATHEEKILEAKGGLIKKEKKRKTHFKQDCHRCEARKSSNPFSSYFCPLFFCFKQKKITLFNAWVENRKFFFVLILWFCLRSLLLLCFGNILILDNTCFICNFFWEALFFWFEKEILEKTKE